MVENAAKVSWELLKNTELKDILQAYSNGAKFYIKNNKHPMEFKLLITIVERLAKML